MICDILKNMKIARDLRHFKGKSRFGKSEGRAFSEVSINKSNQFSMFASCLKLRELQIFTSSENLSTLDDNDSY